MQSRGCVVCLNGQFIANKHSATKHNSVTHVAVPRTSAKHAALQRGSADETFRSDTECSVATEPLPKLLQIVLDQRWRQPRVVDRLQRREVILDNGLSKMHQDNVAWLHLLLRCLVVNVSVCH